MTATATWTATAWDYTNDNGTFTFTEDKDGKDVNIFVTDEQGEDAGSVKARLTSRGYVYLSRESVEDDHRFNGLNKALVEYVIRKFPGKRIELIVADVPHAGHLVEFYKSLGFKLGASANVKRARRDSDSRRMYREATSSF